MTNLKEFRLPFDRSTLSDRRQTQIRVRIRIPKEHQQNPVISNLITKYGLTVNITAALLGANGREDGWFDLDLQGSQAQIQSALIDLNDLDLEIWYDSDQDSW
jgi:ABC-type methionine transport system ATPase subunit